jgi:multiple sugar transport system permease protein
MSQLNLLNSIPAIVMAAVYLWLPLMIYIMRNFFMSIPEELEESARIDGCTKFQAFRLVALPLAKPGIAAITILTYLFSWNEFLFALVISSDLNAMPVAVAVFDFVGDVSVQWASLAAAGILAILVPFIIVLLFQKYIVKGLTSGALKG